jgi:ankyrin repeat protein
MYGSAAFIFNNSGNSFAGTDQAIRDAVTRGDMPAFQRMIQGNPSLLNVCSDSGATLLHLVVCGAGSIPIAKDLILKGANVCAQNYNKWTSLHYAIIKCEYAMVVLLVERGADPNIKNKGTIGKPIHFVLDLCIMSISEHPNIKIRFQRYLLLSRH